jgi:hypothetical protein
MSRLYNCWRIWNILAIKHLESVIAEKYILYVLLQFIVNSIIYINNILNNHNTEDNECYCAAGGYKDMSFILAYQ